jgi:hypothetical protein
VSGPEWSPASVHELLASPNVHGLLLTASRDPDAKFTFLVAAGPKARQRVELAVKIPSTAAAGIAVEQEGRVLVAIRRHPLHEVASTVPRYVESRHIEGRPVLVSTALEGTPMSVRYHAFLHTARPREVARDLDQALAWLVRFQEVTTHGIGRITWPDEVAADLAGRWDGDPRMPVATARLAGARLRLCAQTTPLTAVHGDYWFGNVLVGDRGVTGVIDWECGAGSGQPLRDLARFALSYALYLDRHTREGRRVLGHPRLRRVGIAPASPTPCSVAAGCRHWSRDFLGNGLVALGLPRSLWYDVALVGIAEVAASSNSDAFGAEHLALLSSLPAQPGWTVRH